MMRVTTEQRLTDVCLEKINERLLFWKNLIDFPSFEFNRSISKKFFYDVLRAWSLSLRVIVNELANDIGVSWGGWTCHLLVGNHFTFVCMSSDDRINGIP